MPTKLLKESVISSVLVFILSCSSKKREKIGISKLPKLKIIPRGPRSPREALPRSCIEFAANFPEAANLPIKPVAVFMCFDCLPILAKATPKPPKAPFSPISSRLFACSPAILLLAIAF